MSACWRRSRQQPAIGSGTAAAATSPVVGHVYVNDDTAGTNTIAGFNRHADGTLTPMTGSPFAAGGAGAGSGLASQGALQVAAGGRLLLAVDPGSNQISVLRIGASGALTPISGGVVSSHGVQPVSIAVHGTLVYVANAGNGGSNYTGFRLDSSATCRHLRGSTVSLPDGSQPGDVLFNSTGTDLAGTRVGTSLIDSFRVMRRPAGSGTGLALRRPGPRAVRQRVPAHQSAPAVRVQRTRRGERRHRVGLRGPPAACYRRSGPRPSPTSRRLPAGWRSATTAAICSPSTPPCRASRGTGSRRAAH